MRKNKRPPPPIIYTTFSPTGSRTAPDPVITRLSTNPETLCEAPERGMYLHSCYPPIRTPARVAWTQRIYLRPSCMTPEGEALSICRVTDRASELTDDEVDGEVIRWLIGVPGDGDGDGASGGGGS